MAAVTLVAMVTVVATAAALVMTDFCGTVLVSCGDIAGDTDGCSTGESTVTSDPLSTVTGEVGVGVGVTVDPTSLFGPGRGTNGGGAAW